MAIEVSWQLKSHYGDLARKAGLNSHGHKGSSIANTHTHTNEQRL